MRNPFAKILLPRIFARPHSAILAARRGELSAQITEIDWLAYKTAFGSARKTSHDLHLLLFGSQKQAMAAATRLWSGLCHQHAYLSSAAEPALPFLVIGLRDSNDLLKIEILDILLGFVVCRDPTHPFTERIYEQIAAERPEFEKLLNSADDGVRDFASFICNALDGRPPGGET